MDTPQLPARYRIGRVLEESAFASVWLVHDDRLDDVVAVKVLSGSLVDDPDVRDRFVEEARIMRRADSDRIARPSDIGETPDGRPYFTMPYADSGTLADRLAERRPLPVPEALILAEEIARAVEEINNLGVISHGLKPSQVRFRSTPDGTERAVLSDLGLAEALAHATATFTHPLGTPGYVSPEQARFGGGLDVRADVYGLGALTYHMVAGRPPGPPPVEVPPSELREGVPPEVDAVVMCALDVERERRWPTAAVFAEALAQARGGGPVTLPPTPEPSTWTDEFGLHDSAEFRRRDYVTTADSAEHRLGSVYDSDWLEAHDPGSSVTVLDRPAHSQSATTGSFLARPTSAEPTPVRPSWSLSEDGDDVLSVPLRETFRFIHEPLPKRDSGIPMLGGQSLIESLKQRILRSHGGTFLVAGFRGVGKTTLVMHALDELAREHPEGGLVLPVVLSVARPMTTERLLFSIIRRVFEVLDESGTLERLPESTRRSLLLAYRRTSLSLKETLTDGDERGATFDLDAATALRKVAPGIPVPKTNLALKRMHSTMLESAYLDYSEHDVEYDMMRIVRMLSEGGDGRDRPRYRFRPWRRRRWRPERVHLVIVLDEVDKLTTNPAGLENIEQLLTGMKNVLTMRGIHYLVVAGPDLHDQVLKDSARGNGLYESVFAWRMYVPCNWRAPAKLVENVMRDQPGPDLLSRLRDFDLYLRFKARGVPRRLLHEYNSFVDWREDRPVLRIRPRRDLRISFYARIQEVLEEFLSSDRRDAFPVQIDRDRYRMACYYVVDWILRSEGRPFSMADITAVDEEEAVDPLLRLSENNVESLIAHLARREIVESVRDAGVTSTLMPDVSESRLASYKLSDATLERLWRMALSSETERAELDFPARPRPRDDDDAALEVIGGRYEVRRFIGEGGTSSVYEGYDVVLRRRVAIKILRQRLRSNEGATNRFLREARLTTGLRHPNLVETFELVSRQNELAIVMELVEGELLSARLRRRGAVPPREAVRIAVTLADVLDYLQRAGLARLDVKPHNIVLNPYRGAVVIDLGLAKNVHEAPEAWHTQAGVFVGTPAYMAPEQIHGGPPSIQGDLFALGLVLYTCLNGENPYEGMPSETAMWQIVEHDIDVSSLRISDPLRTLLRELLQRDPVRRSHDPAAVREVLRQTPEYRDESSDATGTVMDQALDSAETSELPREEPGRSSEAASSS